MQPNSGVCKQRFYPSYVLNITRTEINLLVMHFPVYSLVLFVPLVKPVLAKLQTGSCEHEGSMAGELDERNYCINPNISASVTFSFPPLFTSAAPAKFVYAIEKIDSVPSRPRSYMGFWIEYNSVNLNTSGMAMETTIRVFFTENGKSPSGEENGCVGLLGNACVQALKADIREHLLSDENMRSPLNALELRQSSFKNSIKLCPSDLFLKSMDINYRLRTINNHDTMVGERCESTFQFRDIGVDRFTQHGVLKAIAPTLTQGASILKFVLMLTCRFFNRFCVRDPSTTSS